MILHPDDVDYTDITSLDQFVAADPDEARRTVDAALRDADLWDDLMRCDGIDPAVSYLTACRVLDQLKAAVEVVVAQLSSDKAVEEPEWAHKARAFQRHVQERVALVKAEVANRRRVEQNSILQRAVAALRNHTDDPAVADLVAEWDRSFPPH